MAKTKRVFITGFCYIIMKGKIFADIFHEGFSTTFVFIYIHECRLYTVYI